MYAISRINKSTICRMTQMCLHKSIKILQFKFSSFPKRMKRAERSRIHFNIVETRLNNFFVNKNLKRVTSLHNTKIAVLKTNASKRIFKILFKKMNKCLRSKNQSKENLKCFHSVSKTRIRGRMNSSLRFTHTKDRSRI